MRVNTCDNCGKNFWTSDNDQVICYTCCFHMDRAVAEISKQLEIEPVVEKAPIIRPKKWTRETHPKPAPPVRKSQEEKRQQKKIFIEYKMFGYIYLIRSENGFYKIGLSKNIKQRLTGLKSQFPIQMDVIHSFACHDVRKVEKNLHKTFSKKRAQNEWFRLEPDDVSWIMSKKDYSLG